MFTLHRDYDPPPQLGLNWYAYPLFPGLIVRFSERFWIGFQKDQGFIFFLDLTLPHRVRHVQLASAVYILECTRCGDSVSTESMRMRPWCRGVYVSKRFGRGVKVERLGDRPFQEILCKAS